MCLESVDTRIGESNVAGFPAIRAVVEAIHAQVDLLLPLANRAILFAGAEGFRLIALLASDWTADHECLHKNCTLAAGRGARSGSEARRESLTLLRQSFS